MAKVQIMLVRSTADRPRKQQCTARSLGLFRIRRVAVHDDTPQIRGMIAAIRHLVQVEEIADAPPG
ncbi:MAG TPA: 50S ribosomal protein L30 [Armatimonadota bacterium]|nr:50S ribosomal protein L30 [Armatimonadota bacterium]